MKQHSERSQSLWISPIIPQSTSRANGESTSRWTFGASAGYAKRHNLFPKENMVCAKTLYNMLWKGGLPLTVFDMPHTVGRKKKHKWIRRNKRILGRSIEERPKATAERKEFGHWEIDTVVGHKQGRDSVVLTLAERLTGNYISIKIPGKNSDSVKLAMVGMYEQFGRKFSEVVKTITADNGTEFSDNTRVFTIPERVTLRHPSYASNRLNRNGHVLSTAEVSIKPKAS